MFGECLRRVWSSLPEVPDRLLAVIDGSFIEIGPTVKGASVSSRTEKVRTTEGMKTVKRTVIGFKMMVLYVPSERKMKVHEEARAMARGEAEGIPVYRKTRRRKVRRRPEGGGRLRTVTETIEVVGVEGCRTFETYAPAAKVDGNGHKDRHRKTFEPNHINAVVLTRDDGRENVDLVLLTNGSVRRPFVVLDDYDERSRIENEINRELKQRWFIERPPKRTAKAAERHVLFVMLAFTITQGFRLWEEQQILEDDETGTSTLGEYVRKLQRDNSNRLIVFIDDEYGIFYTSELFMLLGRRMRDPAPGAARSLDDLMRRLEESPPGG